MAELGKNSRVIDHVLKWILCTAIWIMQTFDSISLGLTLLLRLKRQIQGMLFWTFPSYQIYWTMGIYCFRSKSNIDHGLLNFFLGWLLWIWIFQNAGSSVWETKAVQNWNGGKTLSFSNPDVLFPKAVSWMNLFPLLCKSLQKQWRTFIFLTWFCYFARNSTGVPLVSETKGTKMVGNHWKQ